MSITTTEYSKQGIDQHRHSNYNKNEQKENTPIKISSFINQLTPVSNILVGKNYDNAYFYQNFLLKIQEDRKDTEDIVMKGQNKTNKVMIKTVHTMKCSKEKTRTIDKRDHSKNAKRNKEEKKERDREESFDRKSKDKKITEQNYKPIGTLTPLSHQRSIKHFGSNNSNNNIQPEKTKDNSNKDKLLLCPQTEQKPNGFVSLFLQVQRLNNIEELGSKKKIDLKEEVSTNNNENDIVIHSKDFNKFNAVDNDLATIQDIDKVNKMNSYKKSNQRSHNISFNKEGSNNIEDDRISRSIIKGHTTISQNKKKRFFCCLPIG